MSNNRKLGNLAQFLDSGSTKSVITASGGAFATEPLLEADLIGTPPSGGLSDSNLVKNLIDINYITETSGYASVSDAIPVILQNTNNIIPDSSGAYDLGDSAKPIAELILDSSATIFFGAFSLTSLLKSGTSSIAVAAVAASAEPVSGSSYTSFLLKADSTQTDAQVDASTNALTITENGNVTSTAFTPYHPKGYSTYFDGDADRLELASLADLSSTAYTIEGWYYFETDPNSATHLLWSLNDENTNGYAQLQTVSGTTTLRLQQRGGSHLSNGTYDFDVNTWYHIATVWDGTNMKVYVNGTEALSSTTNVIQNAGNGLTINGDGGGSYGFAGYVSDFRIVSSAVYTSTFTPPTEPLTAITGTELLTCHLPYIADGSSNDHSITVYGNYGRKLFSPYDHVAYSRSSHSGSVYFDGTGDYLTVTNGFPAIGTSDYTIEFWMYRTAGSGNIAAITDTRTSNTNNPLLWIKSTDEVYYFTNGADAIVGTTTTQINQWYHVALSRSSGVSKLFINGVQEGSSYNDSHSYTQDTLFLGQRYTGTAYNFNGYIADLRVVNGTAVYTADFTPPTEPLTAISGTQLLTCTNKNNIYDTANGSNFTINGDTTASTTQYKWSSSLYIDGTGDSLQFNLPHNLQAMGRSGTECTIECWVYLVSAPASGTYGTAMYSQGTQGSSGGSNVVSFEIQENQTVRALINGSYTNLTGVPISTGTVSTGQWTHLALVLYNQTWTIYINGTADGTGTGSYPSGTTHTTGYVGRVFYGANRTTEMYIEDLRISSGNARYTSNFTPPTAALEG